MIDSDRKAFAEALGGTFELYEKHFTTVMMKLWFAALSNYSIGDVCNALSAHVLNPDTGQYLPKPADVVKHIDGTKKEASAELEFIAQAAWLSIPKAINGVGQYRTPQFHDPITTACVSVIGWKVLCNMTEREADWKLKKFVELYQQFSTKPLDQLPSNIQGLEDVQRLKVGFKAITTALETLEVNKST